MFGRIEHTEGSRRPLLVLLVLVAVFATTVAVQVSRFAGAAGASSEPPSAPALAPSPTDPATPDSGVSYTISGTIRPPLHPGGAALPIDVAFTNDNVGNGAVSSGDVRISSLNVSITTVTGPNINDSRPCSAADFALTQFAGTYPFSVPYGESSLSSLGFASNTWPTLRMKETGTNQNGCKGATVTLAYTGAP